MMLEALCGEEYQGWGERGLRRVLKGKNASCPPRPENASLRRGQSRIVTSIQGLLRWLIVPQSSLRSATTRVATAGQGARSRVVPTEYALADSIYPRTAVHPWRTVNVGLRLLHVDICEPGIAQQL